MTLKTHCKNGHEYTEENTDYYIQKNGKYKGQKYRICKSCLAAQIVGRKPRQRAWHLRTKFGLTENTFVEKLQSQNGCCANVGCLAAEPGGIGAFQVDHDHRTGRIRGLLCFRCNRALGCVDDNPEVLEGLISYLSFHHSGE